MKKDTLSQKIFCLVIVTLGAAICGLGIVLLLQSQAGLDPLTMFEEGLAKTLHISVGNVTLGVNVGMLALGFLINRKDIGLGSVIASFSIGLFVNFFSLFGIQTPSTFAGQVVMNIAGVLLCGLGIAVYMTPSFGVGGMEIVMIFLSEKLHKPYNVIRIGMDCTWGIMGLLLGGTIGIGTVIGVFGIGLSLNFFFNLLQKVLPQKLRAVKAVQ